MLGKGEQNLFTHTQSEQLFSGDLGSDPKASRLKILSTPPITGIGTPGSSLPLT